VACAARAAPDRVCVEFRNRTWMTGGNQDETLGFLAGHGLAYVGVDMPQGHRDSIPPVLAATSPGLAVVRMHGHPAKWDSRDIHERFGYRYTETELTEWAPKVRALHVSQRNPASSAAVINKRVAQRVSRTVRRPAARRGTIRDTSRRARSSTGVSRRTAGVRAALVQGPITHREWGSRTMRCHRPPG
jgi:uncharacterized protein YecE (DUF72 family)